jgi:hypothetical protein
MTGEKKIQIKSAVKSEAAYSYERVDDKNIGKTRVTENTTPTLSATTTTITTKPYTVETTTSSNTANSNGSYATIAASKPGYDASQL